MRERVLITGGEGFIGRHLRSLLPDADILDSESGHDICGDLPDIDYTHIFHLAARKSVWQGELYPQSFINTNCWGSLNLARTYPTARIVNISSSSVNDIKSVYGLTKLFAENIFKLHNNWLNVRLYNVFGEWQPVESKAIIPTLINSRIKGDRPTIYGDGRQSRDFTYVGDVVENLIDIMFESRSTGLKHLGYGDAVSVNDLIKKLCPKARPKYVKARGYEIRCSKSPIAMPKIKFGREEGLKRTIKFYESYIP